MAYKKPETRSLAHHLAAAPVTTVAMMRRDRWIVIARCPDCHLDCWVSLSDLIRLSPYGGETKLWNARTPCRRLGCTGRAVFLATPPGANVAIHFPLMDPPKAPGPGAGP